MKYKRERERQTDRERERIEGKGAAKNDQAMWRMDIIERRRS